MLTLVASRLRAFPPASGPSDFCVTIDHADDPGAALARPIGVARRLFEPEHAIDYFPARGLLYLAAGGATSCTDLAAGLLRIVVRPGDQRAAYVGSHLFVTLPLLEMLKRRDCFALHAAGVVIDGQAVLVAGASGVGKSTLAMACALAGWGFLGDDVVLVRRGAAPRVRAFPDEVDLTADSIAMFPELMATVEWAELPSSGKRAISPLDIAALRLVPDATAAALVFPEREGLEPVSALDPDEALEQLVPNVVRTDVRSAQSHLDALAELARRVPAYRVSLRDVRDAPTLFRRLVRAGARS